MTPESTLDPLQAIALMSQLLPTAMVPQTSEALKAAARRGTAPPFVKVVCGSGPPRCRWVTRQVIRWCVGRYPADVQLAIHLADAFRDQEAHYCRRPHTGPRPAPEELLREIKRRMEAKAKGEL